MKFSNYIKFTITFLRKSITSKSKRPLIIWVTYLWNNITFNYRVNLNKINLFKYRLYEKIRLLFSKRRL